MNGDAPQAHGADSVATARQKYHCPACGAEAHWNPAKQALVCPFCGTESPITLETRGPSTVIVEHDLVESLRAAPEQARGWQVEKISVRCQSCRAISVLDPGQVASRCQFCGSAQVVPYAEVQDAFRPESLLPLKISESEARDLIRAWYKRQWLAPDALDARALTDTVKGVYLPYWTFDAEAHAAWRADSGTYYQTWSNGRRERRVNWTPASGEVDHVFDDELVPASLGVDSRWLREVQPFPTDGLIPYDAGYLAGWTVERYQIDLVAAARRSREQMEATLRDLCGRAVPGDTYRDLVVQATFSNQRFKHILAPVWLMTYTYRSSTYQVVVNGLTGQMAGGRPWSWIKVTLLVAVIALVTLLFLYLNE